MLVLETIVIAILGLIPSLLSLLVIRRAKQRMQARLRQARTMTYYRHQRSARTAYNYEALPQELLGDASCRFNARSPYLRCAVNPAGPCESCRHYEQE